MLRERGSEQGGPEKLEGVKEYLDLEVPHYLEDGVKEVEPSGTFSFLLTEDVNAEVDIYRVELQSGRTVFAAEGGWNRNSVRNVYGAEIPDAETAAKVHIYTLCKLSEANNPDAKGLADGIADRLELPEQFRKTG